MLISTSVQLMLPMLWAGHEQDEPDLTWEGMGKHKKNLFDFAETFTNIATKNIYISDKVSSH